MKRILPIVLLVVILIGGGIWLTRQPDASTAEGDAQAEVLTQAAPDDTADETPTGSDDTAESEAQTTDDSDVTQSDDATDSTAEPTSDVVIPEGFTQTPFLSPTQQQVFEAPEQVLQENTDYQVIIETNKGSMIADLYEADVPITVNNFVFLALNHYYDGIVFHRVLEDFMAQTGDPTGTGTGGPGYKFEDEFVASLRHDSPGTLSMANSGANTNGSQFFITFEATPWLDDRHTVFGKVIQGEEVLDQLTRVDPQTPSAIATLDEPLSDVAAKGIELAGASDVTLRAYLEEKLGVLPAIGQQISVDGYQGMMGRVGEDEAVGFFPKPDVIERMLIIEKPAS